MKTPLTQVDFIVGGRVVRETELLANAPKRLPVQRDKPEKWHKGFLVEGHPPGAMEAARASRLSMIELWAGYTESDVRNAKLRGEKEPRPWDEDLWRRNTKKKPVRKPYAVPAAADECAELARKAGWIDVVVTELKSE